MTHEVWPGVFLPEITVKIVRAICEDCNEPMMMDDGSQPVCMRCRGRRVDAKMIESQDTTKL